MPQTRRGFLKALAAAGGALALRRWPPPARSWLVPSSLVPSAAAASAAAQTRATVALIRTSSHREGVLRALQLAPLPSLRDRTVVIKPNLNSSDPFPGSTHPETLRALLEVCRDGGAREIIIADRSGMGDTTRVIKEKGVDTLARTVGARVLAVETLPPSEFAVRSLPGSSWQRGVLFPRVFERADVIISTCCLKTHRFGGQFTLSLKNSVGMVGRRGPDGYDYMRELHGSPSQRVLIAELNTLYKPGLIVLDGIEAFVEGGPDTGTLARPGVMLAGTDRVAIDAAGVALLRMHGVTGPVAQGPIFAQEQIKRAVQLGIGIASPEDILFVTDSPDGRGVVDAVRAELARA